MGAVNVTVRVDEDTKREFDKFCENVGMNITTALNLFIKATLRTRQLPFAITDAQVQEQQRETVLSRGKEALREAQVKSAINGMSDMTPDDINALIAECRQDNRKP